MLVSMEQLFEEEKRKRGKLDRLRSAASDLVRRVKKGASSIASKLRSALRRRLDKRSDKPKAPPPPKKIETDKVDAAKEPEAKADAAKPDEAKPEKRAANTRRNAKASKRSARDAADSKLSAQEKAKKTRERNAKAARTAALADLAAKRRERKKQPPKGVDKSVGKSKKATIDQIPAQLGHCMLALRYKRKKTDMAAWNICRWSLRKHGYHKTYRKDAGPHTVKQTQKGSQRSFQHGMEKKPLNKGLDRPASQKYKILKKMMGRLEKKKFKSANEPSEQSP